MDNKKKLPAGPETTLDVFLKSMQYRASWPDKEQFLDAVYWQRQVIGFFFGIVFGFLQMNGIFSIAL